MSLPALNNYSNRKTESYVVTIGNITVWFSYSTPVAFQIGGNARVVSNNYWTQTTGRHINEIDGGNKKERVSADEFERLWAEQGTQ